MYIHIFTNLVQRLCFQCKTHQIKTRCRRKSFFQICHVGYKSYNDIEWICHTCRTAIIECRIPKLSIYDKLGFQTQPPELKLYLLEEWLVVLHIPFMQIKNLHYGGQTLVHRDNFNVSVNIAPTVNTLLLCTTVLGVNKS